MQHHIEHRIGSHLVKWSLIAGIVIVLNMFFNYTISLVYPEPKYDGWFPLVQVNESLATEEDCVAVGGQWNGSMGPKNEQEGYCDPDFTKRQAFDEARDLYNRNVFIILSVVGIITLIIGVFVGSAVLSLSLAWGGVLSLVIASARYWSAADDVVKVLILAVALGALMWVAIKKFGK